VGEAVVNDRVEETIRLGVGVVRELRDSVARRRREFEDDLAEGVEARAFARSHGPNLPAMDEDLLQLGRLVEALSGAGGPAESFIAELRLLEQETKAFRDLVAEALSLASKPPGPVDWERLKQESDADFAAGRFTTLETPEDLLKGLGGGD
jgi:hypothetical protein